jgi:hypothetical protein
MFYSDERASQCEPQANRKLVTCNDVQGSIVFVPSRPTKDLHGTALKDFAAAKV